MGLAINDLGVVAGEYSRYADPQGRNQIRSFFYTDLGGSVDAWPQAWTSSAGDINNVGQIALYGGESHDNAQPYRYTPGVGYEWLGTFGGPYGQADAINERGQVTGYSELPDGRARAFRYTDGVGMEYVGGSLLRSHGYGINDLGWVVGTGDGAAFLYRDGIGTTILGPGWAYGVNNAGAVVGGTVTQNGLEAFVYQDGQMQLLGHPDGGEARLLDINERGVAVGTGLRLEGGFLRITPLYWSEATGLIDLNSLLPENSGWYLATATGINEYGQITGSGNFNGTIGLAYRLDLIPEPSTWALLSLGALALWLRSRRRG